MNEITDTQAAYLAGIVDGEGCLNISKRKTKGKSANYQAAIIIASTNTDLIDYIKETTGIGNVYSYETKNPNAKRNYHWKAYGRKAGDFIRCVRPFLIIKARQADLLLELRDDKRSDMRRLTSEDIANRERLKQELHLLNKRGYYVKSERQEGGIMVLSASD